MGQMRTCILTAWGIHKSHCHNQLFLLHQRLCSGASWRGNAQVTAWPELIYYVCVATKAVTGSYQQV